MQQNTILSTVFFDSLCYHFPERGYQKEADERAKQLIANKRLDSWEAVLYERGELPYGIIYEIAQEQARKDICEEFEEGGIYE